MIILLGLVLSGSLHFCIGISNNRFHPQQFQNFQHFAPTNGRRVQRQQPLYSSLEQTYQQTQRNYRQIPSPFAFNKEPEDSYSPNYQNNGQTGQGPYPNSFFSHKKLTNFSPQRPQMQTNARPQFNSNSQVPQTPPGRGQQNPQFQPSQEFGRGGYMPSSNRQNSGFPQTFQQQSPNHMTRPQFFNDQGNQLGGGYQMNQGASQGQFSQNQFNLNSQNSPRGPSFQSPQQQYSPSGPGNVGHMRNYQVSQQQNGYLPLAPSAPAQPQEPNPFESNTPDEINYKGTYSLSHAQPAQPQQQQPNYQTSPNSQFSPQPDRRPVENFNNQPQQQGYNNNESQRPQQQGYNNNESQRPQQQGYNNNENQRPQQQQPDQRQQNSPSSSQAALQNAQPVYQENNPNYSQRGQQHSASATLNLGFPQQPFFAQQQFPQQQSNRPFVPQLQVFQQDDGDVRTQQQQPNDYNYEAPFPPQNNQQEKNNREDVNKPSQHYELPIYDQKTQDEGSNDVSQGPHYRYPKPNPQQLYSAPNVEQETMKASEQLIPQKPKKPSGLYNTPRNEQEELAGSDGLDVIKAEDKTEEFARNQPEETTEAQGYSYDNENPTTTEIPNESEGEKSPEEIPQEKERGEPNAERYYLPPRN